MRSVYEEQIGEATKIQRQLCQGTDKIVRRNEFGSVAKVLWPFKTAAHLATIADTNERTAARWLAGEFEPPYVIVEATMHKIFGSPGD
jgi:hypothetical protein